jgi:hypothetical protein
MYSMSSELFHPSSSSPPSSSSSPSSSSESPSSSSGQHYTVLTRPPPPPPSRPKTSRGHPHPSPDEFSDYVIRSPTSKEKGRNPSGVIYFPEERKDADKRQMEISATEELKIAALGFWLFGAAISV